ncbi:2-keto-4-pentenoate hydratase/2-oxohepta-3-ene-1,7-dioic acid hydratase in catechol pathway [Luteococcus japonicus]|uniref:Fumarylacetoacetate hydrolase family protein n=2 Tax=Luteococcus japonicus TaxID=33984 RepID=A0A1R4JS37_9ACTN|nr:fumarylacetoacetate hydrolase family protein [Luteococcus japonicus]ROR55902.1 2-keto-4-pentenoate hydratase/2-oxohepta-3-ene-1,7-dioic acid hydratase in catechol pathway [Luteococcus japonicus]SJN34818.1 Fumarylacetoacetate hydrolase family protein [Luteococcus japonicus LSP_Lj1]
MRIARYALAGGEPQYGLVELAADAGEHPDTIAAITGDPLAGPVNYTGERHPLDDVRLLAPVIPRSKIVGVGRNYAAHAAEMGNEVPESPLLFFKPNTSVIGPDDPIVRPAACKELHHEGELAVVIGRICKQVPAERVSEVIFGYTVANDVTARDLQASDGQWARAKGSDTFCPLGPWIVTHLSLEESADLQITTTVADQRTPGEGEVRQDDSTRLMVRGVAELVSYISQFTTLLPGDVILTGTPAGVGEITPGQRVTVNIQGIGELANPVVDEQ